MESQSLEAASDDELLLRLADLIRDSRRTESLLVAHIAEVDARKLYAREGSPSMFAYCTEVLRLSEAEAYLRIASARASREFPVLLEMLAEGRLHLSGVGKLAPHLTPENAGALLSRATHKTKRQIEELIAEVAPRPDVADLVRRVPATPAPGPMPALSLERRELRPDAVDPVRPRSAPAVEPLAPGRCKFQFTGSALLRYKLERLQALTHSEGDLAAVIEAAVTEKLERLEKGHFAQTLAPRKTLDRTTTAPLTRHIPAAVRRAVHERDGTRCRYENADGRRCSERTRLEFHHRYPFARGGDHSLPNVALLCRAHNALMAELDCGRRIAGRKRGWQ